MLALTRRKGETIVIDGGITITIVDIRAASVRIAIEAPRDITVLRGELVTKTNERTDNNG